MPDDRQALENALLVTSACPAPNLAASQLEDNSSTSSMPPTRARSASHIESELEDGTLVSNAEIQFVSAVGGQRACFGVDPQVSCRARACAWVWCACVCGCECARGCVGVRVRGGGDCFSTYGHVASGSSTTLAALRLGRAGHRISSWESLWPTACNFGRRAVPLYAAWPPSSHH